MPFLKKLKNFFSGKASASKKDDSGFFDESDLSIEDASSSLSFQLVEKDGYTDGDFSEKCLKQQLGCFQIQSISRGAFGYVFACKVNKAREHLIDAGANLVACKVYCFRDDECEYRLGMRRTSFEQDSKAQQVLPRHPHILNIYSCFQVYGDLQTQKVFALANCSQRQNGNRYKQMFAGVFMEKLDCTVQTLAQNCLPNALSEDERKLIFVQIGDALSYIHRTISLCHLDLKSDNIGVKLGNANGEPNVYKLIDFGNSKRFSAENYNLYLNKRCTFRQNPFVQDAFNFGKMLMALTIPESEHMMCRAALFKAHQTVQYEDQSFKDVLNKLTSENDKITLDEALQLVHC